MKNPISVSINASKAATERAIMRQVLAIDPSLTSTGVCWGSDPHDWEVMVCKSKPLGKNVAERVRRYEGLFSQINQICMTSQPVMIFIEAYAYGANTGSQMYLGEFGGILRWHLDYHSKHIYEVAPSTLKKFVTGKGNAKKEHMLAHVYHQWGRLFDTSDEADAFGLYQMALCAAGRSTPTNKAQRESVAKVLEQNPITARDLEVACNSTDPV